MTQVSRALVQKGIDEQNQHTEMLAPKNKLPTRLSHVLIKIYTT
jgi:hypothetical protein